ncbi:MAG TPA: hypothetical protein PK110_16335 [Niabella sp.]|uniref:hypothetical protein n=1 Tax=Agriterribacter sp. TaxID=2821509 RepID=UPI002C309F72|nr:hypothetical protein [Agriterribacter sp.]HRO86389.1 hypothetical protein [Niabella sp.]HRP55618.1 hypothetical protein [Agriterribacter sp.]
MTKTVAQKMGVKENSRTIFINSDKEIIGNINLPNLDVSKKLEGEFDYIHLFVKKQSEFNDYFPELKLHLKSSGTMWVSWPKDGKSGTD